MQNLCGIDLLLRLGGYERFIQYKISLHPLREQLYNLIDLNAILPEGKLKVRVRNQIKNIQSVLGYSYEGDE